MKIVRSSKCTTKWMTAEKRSTLRRVLEEYGRVVNIFIDHFWNLPAPPIKAELLKPIVDIPETWLTARLRKVAAPLEPAIRRDGLDFKTLNPKSFASPAEIGRAHV